MINAISKILGRKRSGSTDATSNNSSVLAKTKETQNQSLWRKATSLRQSLRHTTSRSKVAQKPDPDATYISNESTSEWVAASSSSPKTALRREWSSQRNLARERRSLAPPKLNVVNHEDINVSKRSLHARSLCVSSDEWGDFGAMGKSTPEGIDKMQVVDDIIGGYQVELPRQQRPSRKLTKDSGYETSAQGDPDYINTLSDWMSEEAALDKIGQTTSSTNEKNVMTVDPTERKPSTPEKRLEWNSRHRPLSFSHQDVPAVRRTRHLRHSYSQKEVGSSSHYHHHLNSGIESHTRRLSTAEPLRFQPSSALKPESRYSSVESITSSGHLAKSTSHLHDIHNSKRVSTASVSNLHFNEKSTSGDNMVTRRFKKGSVYDALASKSGLDFSPVVQLKTFNPRREDVTSSSVSNATNKIWEEPKHQSPEASNKKQHQNAAQHRTVTTEIESTKVVHDEPRYPPIPKVPSPPPPLPPVCTSHEKYPSWPVTSANSNTTASFRSHSWTGQTDYPKEKVGYLRPKKSYKIATNQLQPVLEKSPDSQSSMRKVADDSPSISYVRTVTNAEPQSLSPSYTTASLSNSSKAFDFEAFHTPCIPMCYGDKNYNIHSPPERDISASISSSASSEATPSESNSFLSRYEEVLRHQAQYSSPLAASWNKPEERKDDTANVDTPFLDRLRLDNARAWPMPPAPQPSLLMAPPQLDIELSSENGTWMGSMESSSHGRGIPKWQGSYSDLSTLSTQLSNRSSLFDSGHSTMPESGRLSPQSSCGSTAPSLLLEGPTRAQVVARHGCHREIVAHSARVQQPERHGSESVLYYATGGTSRPQTALSFNVEDADRLRSPEPVAGPSCLRHRSLPEAAAYNHPRSQVPLMGCTSKSSYYNKHADSSKRESRNSNSFSSEDSSFKLKDEDTSGSSSDVSNITCISNYRQPSSQSWDVPPFQSTKPFSKYSGNSNSNQTGGDVTFHAPRLTKTKSNAAEVFSPKNRSNDLPSTYRGTVNQQNHNEVSVNDRNSINGRNQENQLKSRSMDETSRKLLYSDVDKRQRVSEPDLKTIQKQAVFSFYQRMSMAESIKSSNGASPGQDQSQVSPVDSEPPPPYELPSPTRLKLSLPKINLLPNRYSHQEETAEREKHPSDSLQPPPPDTRSPTRADGQTGLLNLHSKSVPNLVAIKNQQTLDVTTSHLNPNAAFSVQQNQHWAALPLPRRGSPLSKDEIISWDQLPIVLEKKRIAAEKAASAAESKDPPEDGSSSATNYFKGHKSPRKVQLKEVHHANDTASVKVITHDGVTLVQTTDRKISKEERASRTGKDHAHHHHHHKRRPAPPPPPKQPPKRPPPPPPPESPPPTSATVVVVLEECGDKDVEREIRAIRIDEHGLERPASSSASSSPNHLGSYSSGGEVDVCSSPELPLPPPPSDIGQTDLLITDEPLPPPPPDALDVDLPNRTLDCVSLVYPKNSYMSYRSEKKLGRQGFDGNYRRSFHVSPVDLPSVHCEQDLKDVLSPTSTWELAHNIRQHGTTVIFHSDDILATTKMEECPMIEDEDNPVNNISPEQPETEPASSQNQCSMLSNSNFHRHQQQQEVIQSKSDEVIECDDHHEDSSIDNGLFTDDSFVDSMESDTSSLLSVDHNQNALKDSRTVPSLVNNNNNDFVVVRTNSSTQTTDTPRLQRKHAKSKEELECERLSMDFVHHYGDSTLKNLLVPTANHKTMSYYMDGLLSVELEKNSIPAQRHHEVEEYSKTQNGHCESPEKLDLRNNHVNRYIDIIENQNTNGKFELRKMRDELMVSIRRKVEILRGEQMIIREEMQRNHKLGKDLTNRVQKLAKPNEVEKFVLHVEEMEKIINLLLSLSGRLAKAENLLKSTTKDTSSEEKRVLEAKRDKLLEQHKDARRLKESIDRRSNQVSVFLHRYLTEEEYADYDYFVKMKTKLIVDTREIDEKINLGEEQLAALQNSMDTSVWKSANS